jgi:hypothetical protein
VKHASAYLRENRVFIWPDECTTAGLWIGALPVLASSPDRPEEVGQNLLDCLSSSKEAVPHPTEWAGGFKPFLSAVGVRSWKAFVTGTKHVGVAMQNETITFEPSRNDGAKGGFVPLPNKTSSASKIPAELGTSLLAAFAKAE